MHINTLIHIQFQGWTDNESEKKEFTEDINAFFSTAQLTLIAINPISGLIVDFFRRVSLILTPVHDYTKILSFAKYTFLLFMLF